MYLNPGASATAGGPVTPKASREELFPRSQHLGVRVLYAPPKPSVDIIFIHGLTGHPFNTFATSDGTYWPTQLLSRDLPTARVLSFGYDADVAKFLGPVGQNNIREHAATLISDVAAARTDDGSESRPIILVVHSLGGLVIKKALCLSEQAVEDHERQLDQCTIGIAFCGTPHRGSDLAPFASGVVKVLKAARKRVNADIVRLLERDSEALADIEASFGTWLRKNSQRIKVTCFFEEHGLLGIGMIVDKHSAKISGYPQLPIPANHMDMVRFHSPEDTGYRRILGEFKRWLRQGVIAVNQGVADAPPQQQLAYEGCMKSIAFPEMNDRGIDITKAADGTCEWILEHPVYAQWLVNERGMLWIKGKPGAGKSTIMKFLLQSQSETARSDVLRVSFFFHGRGTELQKSPFGLLRSTIHQIGRAYPETVARLVRSYEEKQKYEAASSWRRQELEDALASHILPSLLQRTAVRLHIDALDEAGEQEARNVVQFFSRIIEGGSTSPYGLSICFACRHFPIIAPDICDEITVENENDADISAYIDQELSRYIGDPDVVVLLSDEIFQRSQGVFQWVVLVVPQVCWFHQEGQAATQILEAIRRIPPELSTLYASIFDELLQKRPALSLRLFIWVCFGITALSVTETRFALALSPQLGDRAALTDEDLVHVREACRSDQQMRKQLRVLSGGLVELTDSGVQLIHQSVQDFLLQKGFGLLTPDTEGDAETFKGWAHDLLSKSCINYLLAFQEQYTFSSYRKARAVLTSLDIEYPLLIYSVRNWLPHAGEADKQGCSQAGVLEFLGGTPDTFILNWERIAVADVLEHEVWDSKAELDTSLLHQAVSHRIISLIGPAARACPKSLNKNDYVLRLPIALAIESGNEEALFQLLLQPGINLDVQFSKPFTPFTMSISQGNQNMALAIFKHPAFNKVWNLNFASSLIRESTFDIAVGYEKARALDIAVMRGLDDIAARILAQDDKAIKPYDMAHLCRLGVVFKQPQTLKLVLPLAGRMCPERFRQVPYSQILHLAAAIGDDRNVRQLLELGLTDTNLRDAHGFTPFHIAVRKGNQAVIKAFLASDVDVNTVDAGGNTALITAINLKDEDVVQLLVDSPRVDVNIPDEKLAMPLHIAIRTEQPRIARILLRHPNVMVNWRDKTGKTALWDALSRGDNFVAGQLIARTDTDLHLRDYGEQLPSLSTVHKDILDRLERIEENKWTPSDAAFGLVWPNKEDEITPWTVYANSADISGNSLLAWTIIKGWAGSAKLLVTVDEVDVNAPNYAGMTPLMLAMEKGQSEIVRLLLDRPDIEIYRSDIRGRDILSYTSSEDMASVLLNAEMKAIRRSTLQLQRANTSGSDTSIAGYIAVNEGAPVEIGTSLARAMGHNDGPGRPRKSKDRKNPSLFTKLVKFGKKGRGE